MTQTRPTVETDTKFSDLYGGLSDEDESKEAATRPLTKASKTIRVGVPLIPASDSTHTASQRQSIAKITVNAPAIKVEAEDNPVRPIRNRFSGSDLPADIKEHWASKFVPLWRNYTGTLNDPWDNDNPAFATEMQVCFDAVYPDSTYGKIQPNDVVHFVVCHQF